MKSLPFTEKLVLYPPRPHGSTPPDTISKYRGFWGQYKFNGTRNLIYVLPDGGIELWNRHREPHKAYRLTREMRESLLEFAYPLPRGKLHVFDSELMFSKTTTLKDRIVMWDVLVYDGLYFVGSKYKERYDLVKRLAGNPKQYERDTGHELALRVNRNLWLSESFDTELDTRYKSKLALDEIEGLMLKDPNGILEFGVSENNNGMWQVRVRKPTKNYNF